MSTIKTVTTSFRPNANLVKILGEQLISDPVVGLLELVKNGHDADAETVDIRMSGLRRQDAEIVVLDDGCGMTSDDVQNRFLVPATDAKRQQKAGGVRTPGGRLPLGEKGIGRFATQALAHTLELVTRSKDQPEIVLLVDWDKFHSSSALQDVQLEIVERAPQVFPEEWTGTRLTLRGLRQKWGHAELDKLQRGLRRLKSPFPKFGLTAFDIKLVCPDYPKFSHLDPVDLEAFSHYKFRSSIDAQGRITYSYTCLHPAEGLPSYQLIQETPEELRLTSDDTWSETEWEDEETTSTTEVPLCGPFSLTMFVFDRERKYLKHLKTAARNGAELTARDLDAICGVSVFKDDLRVLPYGEPGNDWLRLDQMRINDPSGQLGNKQVVGFLELSQSLNPDLREKADREGFQENKAFNHLRRLTVKAIDVFQDYWSADRPRHANYDKRLQELQQDDRITLLQKVGTISEAQPAGKRKQNPVDSTEDPSPKDAHNDSSPSPLGGRPKAAKSRPTAARGTFADWVEEGEAIPACPPPTTEGQHHTTPGVPWSRRDPRTDGGDMCWEGRFHALAALTSLGGYELDGLARNLQRDPKGSERLAAWSKTLRMVSGSAGGGARTSVKPRHHDSAPARVLDPGAGAHHG